MSQDPNNPNRLDPEAEQGGTFDISTAVTGRFFGNLWGTYNFTAAIDAGSASYEAVEVRGYAGQESIINFGSTVTGRVDLNGIGTLNFQQSSTITATGAALHVTGNGTNTLVINLSGTITGGGGMFTTNNATINFSDTSTITSGGNTSVNNAIDLTSNGTVNLNGTIDGMFRGVQGLHHVTVTVGGTAAIDVVGAEWIELGDNANITIDSGATLTSTLNSGGIYVGDGATLNINIDLVSGDDTLVMGEMSIFTLDAARTLQSLDRRGITVQDDSAIQINGTVLADSAALYGSGDGILFTVGANGTVSSTGSDAIYISGGSTIGNTISIQGDVLAADDGITGSSNNTVSVTGNISAANRGINLSTQNDITIFGSAFINSGGRSISLGSDSTVLIYGGATLTGGIYMSSRAALTIHDGATIGGAVSVSSDSTLSIDGAVTSDGADTVSFGSNSMVTIGQTAVITNLDGDAISGGSNNTISIAGMVSATNDNLAALEFDGNNSLTLLDGGVISARFVGSTGRLRGDAITLFGTDNTFTIGGELRAGDDALRDAYGSNTITVTQTGFILAEDGIVLSNSGTNELLSTVDMQGRIDVTDTGILSFGDDNQITVSGVINGLDDPDDNADYTQAEGLRVDGANSVTLFSGTMNNVSTGLALTGDAMTTTISGTINALESAVELTGEGGTFTMTNTAVINGITDPEFTSGATGILLGGGNQTVDLGGTITTNLFGITGVLADNTLNLSGTINAESGILMNGFPIPPTGVRLLQTDPTATGVFTLTGTINSDGVGVQVLGGINAVINGTINASTDAISVMGEDNIVSFGSNAVIIGNLNFSQFDDTVNLSLASIAVGTTVDLGAGSDTFTGSLTGERIVAGTGDDVIDGRAGDDTLVIYGSRGDFTATEDGGIVSLQYTGDPFFDGGDKTVTDVEFFEFDDGTVTLAELLAGGGGTGPTAGDDEIFGTADPDVIFGLGGNDIIYGYEGDDLIFGGEDDDTIYGGPGDDVLYGEGGDDTIYGQAGDDDISGGTGTDNLFGGDGNDYFDIQFDDTSYDTIDGGDGLDTVDYSNFDFAIWADMAAPSGAEIWTRSGDTVTTGTWTPLANIFSVENIITTQFSDVIFGNSDDNIFGYVGNTGGFDRFDGRGGSDAVDFEGSEFAIWVDMQFNGVEAWTRGGETLTTGTWDTIANFVSIEDVFASSFADQIRGDSGDNTIYYTTNDGAFGAFDRYDGRAGSDTADFRVSEYAVWVDIGISNGIEAWNRGGIDVLTGTWEQIANLENIENLTGSWLNDQLFGDNSANIINGSFGNDLMSGRGGADTFVFDGEWGQDRITDFANGIDSFDLSALGITFTDLSVVNDSSGDAVISYDGQSITLSGVDAGLIDVGDFAF